MMPFFAIRKCKQIIKKNSLTFYKAFSKIEDKKKRNAIYAVYAFCRYADDLVDEYQDEKALDQLEQELTQFKNGQPNSHFRWIALNHYARPFYGETYDYQPFFDMIKGQRMDLNHQGYETFEDFLGYCYHVAGTVGLMLIPILAPESNNELDDFAVNLGYAMQITNILRDVGEDHRHHRVYLPKDLMEEANFSRDDLARGIINIEFINLFETLAKRAEAYFEEALNKIDLFPNDAKLPLALSIILYRAILDACRESRYQVFTQKNFVSHESKNRLIESYLKSKKGESL